MRHRQLAAGPRVRGPGLGCSRAQGGAAARGAADHAVRAAVKRVLERVQLVLKLVDYGLAVRGGEVLAGIVGCQQLQHRLPGQVKGVEQLDLGLQVVGSRSINWLRPLVTRAPDALPPTPARSTSPAP